MRQQMPREPLFVDYQLPADSKLNPIIGPTISIAGYPKPQTSASTGHLWTVGKRPFLEQIEIPNGAGLIAGRDLMFVSLINSSTLLYFCADGASSVKNPEVMMDFMGNIPQLLMNELISDSSIFDPSLLIRSLHTRARQFSRDKGGEIIFAVQIGILDRLGADLDYRVKASGDTNAKLHMPYQDDPDSRTRSLFTNATPRKEIKKEQSLGGPSIETVEISADQTMEGTGTLYTGINSNLRKVPAITGTDMSLDTIFTTAWLAVGCDATIYYQRLNPNLDLIAETTTPRDLTTNIIAMRMRLEQSTNMQPDDKTVMAIRIKTGALRSPRRQIEHS